ncbi:MAG: galactokinase, partial [Firmicutes bacterium]|nr:galactokinase [Bacillota bacterium]
MTTIDLKNILNGESFKKTAKNLYGADAPKAEARILSLAQKHTEKFKGDFKLFSSPGRIEVIGNHTDHNNGKVVASAVSVDTLGAVSLSQDNFIKIVSQGYNDTILNINSLLPDKSEEGSTASLVRGVLKGFTDRGFAIGGFNATVESSVPKGAGMSSSASFELLIAEILNVFFNGGKISAIEKAQISQF